MRFISFLFLLSSTFIFTQDNAELVVCFGERSIEKAYRISETPQKISLESTYGDSTQLQKNDKLIVSFPECNAMYAGYGNLMHIESTRRRLRKTTLKCEGCDTLYQLNTSDNSAWVIRANKSNRITLRTVNKKGKTISKVEIPVFELPPPIVFFDTLNAQTTLSSLPNIIRLKLMRNIPISASFGAARWEIVVNNRKSFEGVGNKLSDELREYMKSQQTGTISATILYFGPDSPKPKTVKEIFEFNLSL